MPFEKFLAEQIKKKKINDFVRRMRIGLDGVELFYDFKHF